MAFTFNTFVLLGVVIAATSIDFTQGINTQACKKISIGLTDSGLFPNNLFSATSSAGESKPYDVRYNSEGWSPRLPRKNSDYLEIKFESPKTICAIGIKGGQIVADKVNHMGNVKTLKFSYLVGSWRSLNIFGTKYPSREILNVFSIPLIAKSVRFYPRKGTQYPVMRVQLYGMASGSTTVYGKKPSGSCNKPLGMENYGIDNSQIAASTETTNRKDKYGKQSARLNSKYVWRNKEAGNNKEFIQVDLEQIKSVTGIAMQGDPNTAVRVTKFKVQYSKDGKSWVDYKMSALDQKSFRNYVLRWIFLGILLQWHLTSSQTLFTSTNSMQNAYLKGFAFQVFTGITSYFECYMKCQEDEYCYSVNFYPAKSVCELNSVTHQSYPDYLVHGDPHATYFMDSTPSFYTGQDESLPAPNCLFLKTMFPSFQSGSYWLDVDKSGPNAPFQGYCDMETDGGGWTLVWSFTFSKYSTFQNDGNFVTPMPKHFLGPPDAPLSETPPKSETDFNALHFGRWKAIGKDFLVKSNINNWVSCVPGTGSLVTKTIGSLSCTFIKQIVTEQPSCLEVPGELAKTTNGYKLLGLSTNEAMYYFEKSSSAHWPTHDPCASNQPNHKKNVPNPHTNVYIR